MGDLGEQEVQFLARLALSLLKPRSCNTFQDKNNNNNNKKNECCKISIKFKVSKVLLAFIMYSLPPLKPNQLYSALALLIIAQHYLALALPSISIAQHQYCLALALPSISIAQHQHFLALPLQSCQPLPAEYLGLKQRFQPCFR